MPKIDLDTIEQTNRTGYPPPYDGQVAGRWYRRLGPDAGLSDMGVSHVTLEPGAWSSQRHWHEGIDEFVVMLAGEAVLVEESGETILKPGDCAAFPKDVPSGHHLVNRSDRPCSFLAFDVQIGEGDCHTPTRTFTMRSRPIASPTRTERLIRRLRCRFRIDRSPRVRPAPCRSSR